MTYWRLYYHVTWATRNREHLIGASLSASLHGFIASKASRLGAVVHAVGGIEDHVHLVVSVPPTTALSEFIRQLKGASSHFANHEFMLPYPFNWQPEYGVVSFDSGHLDRVVDYVKNQQLHHSNRTIIPIFERVSADLPGRVGTVEDPDRS